MKAQAQRNNGLLQPDELQELQNIVFDADDGVITAAPKADEANIAKVTGRVTIQNPRNPEQTKTFEASMVPLKAIDESLYGISTNKLEKTVSYVELYSSGGEELGGYDVITDIRVGLKNKQKFEGFVVNKIRLLNKYDIQSLGKTYPYDERYFLFEPKHLFTVYDNMTTFDRFYNVEENYDALKSVLKEGYIGLHKVTSGVSLSAIGDGVRCLLLKSDDYDIENAFLSVLDEVPNPDEPTVTTRRSFVFYDKNDGVETQNIYLQTYKSFFYAGEINSISAESCLLMLELIQEKSISLSGKQIAFYALALENDGYNNRKILKFRPTSERTNIYFRGYETSKKIASNLGLSLNFIHINADGIIITDENMHEASFLDNFYKYIPIYEEMHEKGIINGAYAYAVEMCYGKSANPILFDFVSRKNIPISLDGSSPSGQYRAGDVFFDALGNVSVYYMTDASNKKIFENNGGNRLLSSDDTRYVVYTAADNTSRIYLDEELFIAITERFGFSIEKVHNDDFTMDKLTLHVHRASLSEEELGLAIDILGKPTEIFHVDPNNKENPYINILSSQTITSGNYSHTFDGRVNIYWSIGDLFFRNSLFGGKDILYYGFSDFNDLRFRKNTYKSVQIYNGTITSINGYFTGHALDYVSGVEEFLIAKELFEDASSPIPYHEAFFGYTGKAGSIQKAKDMVASYLISVAHGTQPLVGGYNIAMNKQEILDLIPIVDQVYNIGVSELANGTSYRPPNFDHLYLVNELMPAGTTLEYSLKTAAAVVVARGYLSRDGNFSISSRIGDDTATRDLIGSHVVLEGDYGSVSTYHISGDYESDNDDIEAEFRLGGVTVALLRRKEGLVSGIPTQSAYVQTERTPPISTEAVAVLSNFLHNPEDGSVEFDISYEDLYGNAIEKPAYVELLNVESNLVIPYEGEINGNL